MLLPSTSSSSERKRRFSEIQEQNYLGLFIIRISKLKGFILVVLAPGPRSLDGNLHQAT